MPTRWYSAQTLSFKMKRSVLTLLLLISFKAFAASPVEVVCIADRDVCTAELQAALGPEFNVSTRSLDAASAGSPDIIISMKGFPKDEYYWMLKGLRSIPSHPDIFFCGKGEWATGLAARAWTDAIPADVGSDSPAQIADAIRKVLMANGWGHIPRRRIVIAGDSITDGSWGGADSKPASQRNHYDMNHIYGHGYAEMIAATLLGRYPERNYRIYNRGIGGGKLQGLAERWDEEVLAVKPDVISILIGVNDAATDGTPVDFEAWESTYRSLLDRALDSNPDCRFVLCTPFAGYRGDAFPNDTYRARKASTDRFDDIIRHIASDYGAVLVDFAPMIERLIATDRSGDHNYWVWDGVHPTTPTHMKMAELWIKKSRQIL